MKKVLDNLFDLVRFCIGMTGVILMICETPDESMQLKVMFLGILLFLFALVSGIFPAIVDVALTGMDLNSRDEEDNWNANN